MKTTKTRGGFTLIEMMIVISIISILLLLLLPNYVRARSRSRLNACESNLKNMATACEMYSTDNARLYPPSLTTMVPNYLRALSTCPSSGTTSSYVAGFSSAMNPDAYTVACNGSFTST